MSASNKLVQYVVFKDNTYEILEPSQGLLDYLALLPSGECYYEFKKNLQDGTSSLCVNQDYWPVIRTYMEKEDNEILVEKEIAREEIRHPFKVAEFAKYCQLNDELHDLGVSGFEAKYGVKIDKVSKEEKRAILIEMIKNMNETEQVSQDESSDEDNEQESDNSDGDQDQVRKFDKMAEAIYDKMIELHDERISIGTIEFENKYSEALKSAKPDEFDLKTIAKHILQHHPIEEDDDEYIEMMIKFYDLKHEYSQIGPIAFAKKYPKHYVMTDTNQTSVFFSIVHSLPWRHLYLDPRSETNKYA